MTKIFITTLTENLSNTSGRIKATFSPPVTAPGEESWKYKSLEKGKKYLEKLEKWIDDF